MNKKSCQNCLFADQCPSGHPCRHYSPIDGDSEEAADDLIRRGYEQFRREWDAYIADAQPSDF